MNQVVLIGRLCQDPSLRYSSAGTAVTNFTLAVDRYKKGEADFINIVAWKAQAENCAKYLAKGSQVAVEGRIQTRKYQDRDGNNRTAFEVVANSVQFLSRMRQPGEDVDQVAADMFGGQIDEDDCPF
jgi:single-strand DNA-binding protein